MKNILVTWLLLAAMNNADMNMGVEVYVPVPTALNSLGSVCIFTIPFYSLSDQNLIFIVI